MTLLLARHIIWPSTLIKFSPLVADTHNTISDKVGKFNHDSTYKKSAVTPCVHLTLTLNTSSIIFQIKFCTVFLIFSNKSSNL